MTDGPPGFERHIRHCNNTILPGHRHALHLGSDRIGYIEPALATGSLLDGLLHREDDAFRFDDQAGLNAAAYRLADARLITLRDELFDVRATEDGPVLATLDRGALPNFGIAATGVHLNGLVHKQGEIHLWVARRASNKLLDPGKLDHLAAGGVPAGMTARECLAKEAAEECGLTEDQIATAIEVATIRYAMQRPEGLRRDVLRCYDIFLPDTWQPIANDGEVEAFELWPLQHAFNTVHDTDEFKFNVNLVLIDLFQRQGLRA